MGSEEDTGKSQMETLLIEHQKEADTHLHVKQKRRDDAATPALLHLNIVTSWINIQIFKRKNKFNKSQMQFLLPILEAGADIKQLDYSSLK